MSTRRLYLRRFLNRPGHHAGAYVIAQVDVHAGRKGHKGHVDAALTIADCRRVVELEFSAYGEAEAENALRKARLLRDIVTEFTEVYERALVEGTLTSKSEVS